jgi:hypothetical protein
MKREATELMMIARKMVADGLNVMLVESASGMRVQIWTPDAGPCEFVGSSSVGGQVEFWPVRRTGPMLVQSYNVRPSASDWNKEAVAGDLFRLRVTIVTASGHLTDEFDVTVRIGRSPQGDMDNVLGVTIPRIVSQYLARNGKKMRNKARSVDRSLKEYYDMHDFTGD